MKRLTVLQVMTHSKLTRGGAFQCALLARGLNELGHIVCCLFHSSNPQRARETTREFSELVGTETEILFANMRDPRDYVRFRRFIKDRSFDVIHAHRNLALVFSYFVTIGLPIAAFVANRGTTYPLPNPVVRHVFGSERLDHVIAVSGAVRDVLLEREGLDPGKVSVIYGSFDERRFRPGLDGAAVRREFNCAPNAPLIGNISAVDRRKGLEFFIRAAPAVIERYPSARFVIVGAIQDLSYHRLLDSEIRRLGLRDRVIFAGHRKDIPEMIAALDVSINTSVEGEGLTGAIRESLAMKTPVICTRVCGNPELVIEGLTGLLVPPRDPEALSKAIINMLSNREKAREMAERGYERVQEIFSNRRRSKEIESLYLSVIRKNRAGWGKLH